MYRQPLGQGEQWQSDNSVDIEYVPGQEQSRTRVGSHDTNGETRVSYGTDNWTIVSDDRYVQI